MAFTAYELSDGNPSPTPGWKVFVAFLVMLIVAAVAVALFHPTGGK